MIIIWIQRKNGNEGRSFFLFLFLFSQQAKTTRTQGAFRTPLSTVTGQQTQIWSRDPGVRHGVNIDSWGEKKEKEKEKKKSKEQQRNRRARARYQSLAGNSWRIGSWSRKQARAQQESTCLMKKKKKKKEEKKKEEKKEKGFVRHTQWIWVGQAKKDKSLYDYWSIFIVGIAVEVEKWRRNEEESELTKHTARIKRLTETAAASIPKRHSLLLFLLLLFYIVFVKNRVWLKYIKIWKTRERKERKRKEMSRAKESLK